MTSQPTISVIIPTYYRNERLAKSINSVLDQNCEKIEIIVVDDSGENNAEGVVKDYNDSVEYIGLSENKGAQIARNIGFQHASGDYIQFLDDDDCLLDGKIERQVNVLENNSDIDVVYCGVKHNEHISLPKSDGEGDVLKESLMFNTWPCMYSTMLTRASILNNIFPLDPLPGADDLDLIIELASTSLFAYVNQALVLKRESEDSRGRSVGAALGRFQIINKHSNHYDKFESEIRSSALADAYRKMGGALVQEEIWSLKAIICYLKSIYYHDGFSMMLIVEAVVTLFGNPGWKLASYIHQKIQI